MWVNLLATQFFCASGLGWSQLLQGPPNKMASPLGKNVALWLKRTCQSFEHHCYSLHILFPYCPATVLFALSCVSVLHTLLWAQLHCNEQLYYWRVKVIVGTAGPRFWPLEEWRPFIGRAEPCWQAHHRNNKKGSAQTHDWMSITSTSTCIAHNFTCICFPACVGSIGSMFNNAITLRCWANYTSPTSANMVNGKSCHERSLVPGRISWP